MVFVLSGHKNKKFVLNCLVCRPPHSPFQSWVIVQFVPINRFPRGEEEQHEKRGTHKASPPSLECLGLIYLLKRKKNGKSHSARGAVGLSTGPRHHHFVAHPRQKISHQWLSLGPADHLVRWFGKGRGEQRAKHPVPFYSVPLPPWHPCRPNSESISVQQMCTLCLLALHFAVATFFTKLCYLLVFVITTKRRARDWDLTWCLWAATLPSLRWRSSASPPAQALSAVRTWWISSYILLCSLAHSFYTRVFKWIHSHNSALLRMSMNSPFFCFFLFYIPGTVLSLRSSSHLSLLCSISKWLASFVGPWVGPLHRISEPHPWQDQAPDSHGLTAWWAPCGYYRPKLRSENRRFMDISG